MIIMPPRELMQYMSTDEDGKWVVADNMPKELEEVYAQFVKKTEEADKYKKTFFEQD